MSDKFQFFLYELRRMYDGCNAERLHNTAAAADLREINQQMAVKYDEALKRIQDLTAELEYLRREVNR